MSKCKASQDAGVIQALGLERYDKTGRLMKVQLKAAKNDLEERRNVLAQLLVDLKDATNYLESVARDFGRADELTVLPNEELKKRAKRAAGKVTDYRPVRGYAMGVDFRTLANDYIANQIYFFAAQQAFTEVQKAIKEQ